MTIPPLRDLAMQAEPDELLPFIGELSAALAIASARQAAPVAMQAAEPDDEMTAEEVALDLKLFKLDGVTPKTKGVYKLAERANDPLPCWRVGRKFRVPRRGFQAWKLRQRESRG